MHPLWKAIAEALEAGSVMTRALLAAAKLLKDCSCQNHRAVEARAAQRLAEEAISKWELAATKILQLARDAQRTD